MGATVTKFQKRSGIADVDVLIYGYKWGGAAGSGPSLTFSFAGENSRWPNGYPQAEQGLSYLTSLEKSAIREILELIDGFIRLDFKEVVDAGKNFGEIRFAKTDIDGLGGTLAEAYTPQARRPANGDVWFDVYDAVSNFDNYNTAGIQGRVVAMHEILHALGLRHPREGTYRSDETIMNPSAPGTSMRWYSPMPNDVAALQLIYGAEKFNGGNTLYDREYFADAFGPNFVAGSQRDLLTLWDSGGIDTVALDIHDISLDPNTREFDCGIMIARRAVIENFITSLYHADVIGNAAANHITVGGDIRIHQSYDSYNYLSHWTRMDTQGGDDTVILPRVYYNSLVSSVNNSNVIVSHTFYQDIFLGRGNDVCHGSFFVDYLQGSEGDDMLYGYEGDDQLHGDAGNVRQDANGGLIYEKVGGIDTLHGGEGNDIIFGSMGRDILFGDEGADTFRWLYDREVSSNYDANVDEIMDFRNLEGDKIRLPMYSGRTYSFIGAELFTGEAYQISIAKNLDDSWKVLVDTDGDKDADWIFKVNTGGGDALMAADFFL